MSERLSGRESKAISLPSGDQRGVPVWRSPKDVNCSGLVPSAAATHTSHEPVRSDVNTIRLPSGEYCGPTCNCRDPINNAGSFGVSPSDGIGYAHIFVDSFTCTYAR